MSTGGTEWKEESNADLLSAHWIWQGTVHWIFNSVTGICILFWHLSAFCFVFLRCVYVFSLHSTYAKEYFVGRLMFLLRRNALHGVKSWDCGQDIFLLRSKTTCTCAKPAWEQNAFVQPCKARLHSGRGCSAGASTACVCCPHGKLRLLSQISTQKKNIYISKRILFRNIL